MKPKVLFIVNAFPSRDRPTAGVFNFRAATQLSREADLDIVLLRAWKPKRSRLNVDHYENFQVTSFAYPFTDRFSARTAALSTGIYARQFFKSLRQQINKADLIHSVGASLAGIVGSYASMKSGIPHIAQVIGSDINFDLPRMDATWPIRGWEKNVSLCCCNSNALSDAFTARYPTCATQVIYRGVNAKTFKFRDNTYLKDKPLTFLYLGGLSLRKGNPHGQNLKGGVTLLKAWKIACNNDGSNWGQPPRLLFGGPDTSDVAIDTILGTNHSDLGVTNIGQVPREQVAEHMHQAQVVVVPSMAEGLPNIGMEASATGPIVVGSRTGGIPELVEHEKTGFLFKPGCSQELARILIRINAQSEALEKMSLAARMKTEKEFDCRSFPIEYLKAYTKVISERSAAS